MRTYTLEDAIGGRTGRCAVKHEEKHEAWDRSLGGQWVLVADIPYDPEQCMCGWYWTPAERAANDAEAAAWDAEYEAMRAWEAQQERSNR